MRVWLFAIALFINSVAAAVNIWYTADVDNRMNDTVGEVALVKHAHGELYAQTAQAMAVIGEEFGKAQMSDQAIVAGFQGYIKHMEGELQKLRAADIELYERTGGFVDEE